MAGTGIFSQESPEEWTQEMAGCQEGFLVLQRFGICPTWFPSCLGPFLPFGLCYCMLGVGNLFWVLQRPS